MSDTNLLVRAHRPSSPASSHSDGIPIDAKNLDEAIAIAERISMAHKGTVEIRPVIEILGLPGG